MRTNSWDLPLYRHPLSDSLFQSVDCRGNESENPEHRRHNASAPQAMYRRRGASSHDLACVAKDGPEELVEDTTHLPHIQRGDRFPWPPQEPACSQSSRGQCLPSRAPFFILKSRSRLNRPSVSGVSGQWIDITSHCGIRSSRRAYRMPKTCSSTVLRRLKS